MNRPTIKDVAELARVSVGTASKVINKKGNVSAGSQLKVDKAIKQLRYSPNEIARGLRSSSTKIIALLLADYTNPFQMMLAKGIESITYDNGYQIIISSTRENSDIEKQYLSMLYKQRVDGVIICTTGKANNAIKRIMNSKTPIVLVDRPIYEFPIDIVADNSEIGTRLLVEHLLDLNHERIGIIHGNKQTIHGELRMKGFLKALHKNDVEESNNLQYDGNFAYEDGVKAVRKFSNLSSPPTAVISSNNNMTAGLMHECNRLGINIPNDLSVVSYGNLEYSWDLIKPRITYVSQSPFNIGEIAAKLIFKRLHKEKINQQIHRFLTPEIKIRESTKKL